jgi:hypothetical protein
MATVQATLTLKRVDTAHAGNISAAQCQAEFPKKTREDDGKLFRPQVSYENWMQTADC